MLYLATNAVVASNNASVSAAIAGIFLKPFVNVHLYSNFLIFVFNTGISSLVASESAQISGKLILAGNN